MTNHTMPPSLCDHLLEFGIQHFQDESYWAWGGEKLGKKVAAHLDKLRKPLVRGKPKKADLFAFYEFIAAPAIASVVHSWKADAIRATGEFVSSRVQGGRILDVGCGIGYLTSWYALQNPMGKALGLDFSPTSIERAKCMATNCKIANLEFNTLDGNQFVTSDPFDFIVDTQGLIDPLLDSKGIQLLFSWLHPDGKLIAVPAFGSLPVFEAFLDKIDCGLISILSLDWVHFSDLGRRGMYPGMVLTHSKPGIGQSRTHLLDQFREGLVSFNQAL